MALAGSRAGFGPLPALAAAAALAAPAAHAEVTARQVWDNFREFQESQGYEIRTESLDESGAGIAIRGLRIGFPDWGRGGEGAPSGDIAMEIPEVTLTGNGDGSVGIHLPDSHVVSAAFTLPEPPGDMALAFPDDPLFEFPVDLTMDLVVDHPGVEITASGEPGLVAYEVSARRILASRVEFGFPAMREVEQALEMLGFAISADGLEATWELGTSGTPTSEIRGAVAEASVDVNFNGGPRNMLDMLFAVEDLEWSSINVFPKVAVPGDMAAMLRAGLESDLAARWGATRFGVDLRSPDDAFRASGGGGAGSGEASIADGAMSFLSEGADMEMEIEASTLPLPAVSMSVDSASVAGEMPVLVSGTPEDAAMDARIDGLSIGEGAWSLFDPSGILPRDPATIVLDLSGKARLLFDIMNPAAPERLTGDAPLAIHSLDVNEILLAFAGAALSGSGSFDFGPDGLSADDDLAAGASSATGKIDLRLDGGVELLGRLVEAGLVTMEQAMGTQAMLGAFTRPGDGPDSLLSTIEADGASGALSVNGQRVR